LALIVYDIERPSAKDILKENFFRKQHNSEYAIEDEKDCAPDKENLIIYDQSVDYYRNKILEYIKQ